MEKTRLFKKTNDITNSTITITKDEYHYLKNVIRAKENCEITIILNNDSKLITSLKKINKETIEINTLKSEKLENKRTFTLVQCLPKQDKFSDTIRMCTEIGVNRFIPIISKRSIPRKVETKKHDRWKSILISSAIQSEQNHYPILDEAYTFKAFIDNYTKILESDSIKICPWEEEKKLTLKNYFKTTTKLSSQAEIVIFIGPEGGLCESEISLLKKIGFNTITLGNTILRTQHAGFYTMSQIKYELE